MAFKDLIPFRKNNAPVRREDDNPFLQLNREMNRLFDDFFKGFDIEPFGFSGQTGKSFSPIVDITETNKAITISAELPGMDEKDVDVSLSDNTLTIRGEKKEEQEEKKDGYYRSERSYGSFTRSIPVPYDIDQDTVSARFKKGVLTITMPKSAEAMKETKKIAVSTD